MKDKEKTKEELIKELVEFRQRIDELKTTETERKCAEERIQHLNLVLRAIRKVNQLITKEEDRDRLLQGTCKNLIETRGYYNAWVALFDESGGLLTTTEAGLGKNFLPMADQLKRGELTYCARRALNKPNIIVIKDPLSTCGNCPLSPLYGNRGAMTSRLEYKGKLYGLLSVSIPRNLIEDKEEQSLFEEVAGDISFALHNKEIEEERKQAEEALHREKEKFRVLVEKSPLGVSIIGEDGRYEYINPTFIEIFGYTLEDIPTGREWFIKAYPDKEYRHQVISTWKTDLEKVKHGESRPRTFNITSKDGSEKMIHFTSVAIESGDQFVIYEDITERKRLEAQLFQAQKMEAIGILAGGVAHDFNNILTAIQGYADLAMMKVDETDPLYRDLKQIDISATRAASLTRQLLLFSRRQPMQFTSFNLNTTVDNLLKMLHRLIGEDITINTDLDSELWTVQADAGNIEQAIMNLTVNARDAMPEGGIINIKTESVNVDKQYCKTYTYARPAKFVCLTVEDTGIGMDKETIQHIFEPFFSTKGPGKGTGLGLSVVYGIVKQHEGWVNVYSEPGQGSTLRFYLPAISIKPKKESKEKISLDEFQGSGERILLVEDEEGVREFAIKALGENGYIIYEAANAEEALNIFEKEAGNFDLIFSDVVLPGKSGLQLVDQLLPLKGKLKVLLSSGYTDHKSQWPVIQERGFRFLQKPYALTDLLRAIKEAIRQDK